MTDIANISLTATSVLTTNDECTNIKLAKSNLCKIKELLTTMIVYSFLIV